MKNAAHAGEVPDPPAVSVGPALSKVFRFVAHGLKEQSDTLVAIIISINNLACLCEASAVQAKSCLELFDSPAFLSSVVVPDAFFQVSRERRVLIIAPGDTTSCF